jgi:hypothetical protein
MRRATAGAIASAKRRSVCTRGFGTAQAAEIEAIVHVSTLGALGAADSLAADLG